MSIISQLDRIGWTSPNIVAFRIPPLCIILQNFIYSILVVSFANSHLKQQAILPQFSELKPKSKGLHSLLHPILSLVFP